MLPFTVVEGPGIWKDGSTDSAPAIQALINAVPAGGGTLYFPAGTYRIERTLDLGSRSGLRLVGEGRSGQSTFVGLGATVLHFVGTGYCIQWAVGASSAQFSGVTIESLCIEGSGSMAPEGGIFLGNSSNSLIAECTVSDFRNGTITGTGIRIGEDSSIGAQYNTIRDCTLSRNDIGVENRDANGTRIMGGFMEDQMVLRPGTYGVRFRRGSDTGIMVGVVVQGAETLVDIEAETSNVTLSACRYEGFTTAVRIAASFCNVMGGSMNNFIVGGGGTGILIEPTALATFVMLPGIGATAATVTDHGSLSTVLADVRSGGSIEHNLNSLKTQNLVVNKVGPGAQSPAVTLKSNGVDGPIIGTASWFQTMFLDHAYSDATRLSLRVRGIEALALADGNKLGFFGLANPIAKPNGTPAAATNLATALTLLNDLRAKLIALGLID
jgi:polygalacturonase